MDLDSLISQYGSVGVILYLLIKDRASLLGLFKPGANTAAGKDTAAISVLDNKLDNLKSRVDETSDAVKEIFQIVRSTNGRVGVIESKADQHEILDNKREEHIVATIHKMQVEINDQRRAQ